MTMLLHGAFDGNRFLVWGEVPSEQAPRVRKPRGRRPKGSPPGRLPFDTGAEALAAALSLGSTEMENRPADTTTLWLPSVAACRNEVLLGKLGPHRVFGL